MVTDDGKIEIPRSLALSILSQLGAYVQPESEALVNTKPQTWQEIKTFEDACKIVSPTENQTILLSYNGQDKDMLAAVAFMKLTIISRAMNMVANDGELWQPDWSNTDEYKYYPWLKYVAGSGFSDSAYGYVSTSTSVGSRLCYKTSEMARHAAVHFKDLYNDLFTL